MLAFWDSITGMANRTCFRLHDQVFPEDAFAQGPDGLLSFNLDSFNFVNRAIGDDIGVYVLGELCARLKSVLGGMQA